MYQKWNYLHQPTLHKICTVTGLTLNTITSWRHNGISWNKILVHLGGGNKTRQNTSEYRNTCSHSQRTILKPSDFRQHCHNIAHTDSWRLLHKIQHTSGEKKKKIQCSMCSEYIHRYNSVTGIKNSNLIRCKCKSVQQLQIFLSLIVHT